MKDLSLNEREGCWTAHEIPLIELTTAAVQAMRMAVVIPGLIKTFKTTTSFCLGWGL